MAEPLKWKVGFAIRTVAVALWIGYAIAVTRDFDHNLDQQSKFGDMFGGIGALFSGLALPGVMVAIGDAQALVESRPACLWRMP